MGKQPDEPEQKITKDNEPSGFGHLVQKLKDGESLLIGDDIEVKVQKSRRGRSDLSIRAPRKIPIKKITP